MSAHFQSGNLCNDIVLVFSCPGRIEEQEDRPCAGATGRNMEALLRILNQKVGSVFKSADRLDYRITNAYASVLFMKRSNRTEASDAEIRSKENIERLTRELAGAKLILCFGNKASAGLKAAGDALTGVKLIEGLPHLGNQAVNMAWKNDDPLLQDCLTGEERRLKRLELIAEKIIAKLS